MPFPGTFRSSFGQAVVGDRLYIAGGHLGPSHQYKRTAFSDEFHSVDIATGTDAQQLSPLKVPAQGFRLAATAGEIYAFGGFRYDEQLDYTDPDPNSFHWYARSTDVVWRYSLARDEWSAVGTLPRRRSSNVIGVHNNIVYMVGGWDGTPWIRNDYIGRLHSVCDAFDISTKKVLPQQILMPSPKRRAFTGAVLAGKLYIAGGLGVPTEDYPEGENFDEFSCYDMAHDTWSTSYYGQLPRLKTPLFSPGMGAVGDALVLTGGSEPNHRINQSVWLWKPGMPQWIENSVGLSAKVTFPEVVAASPNRALVFGGHSSTNPAGVWEYLPIDPV